MDEAGLPEESHESLKVAILYQVAIAAILSLNVLLGTSLSFRSTGSSICCYHKSCLRCSKNQQSNEFV